MAKRKVFTVSVPTSGLNVREAPDKSAGVLRVLPNGEKVTIDPDALTAEGWSELQDGGYVMTEFLK